ncbi:copper resistance protein B [Lysobacter korlensis]|uniref:Copper resistance protein B n=1 Tax=Lysobacter korlensis TaxID=553636 RepID=A0ABV6RU61_9GAMM
MSRVTKAVAGASVGLMLAVPAAHAQHHSHPPAQQDHSLHRAKSGTRAAATQQQADSGANAQLEAARPANDRAGSASGADHSKMGHSEMDHSGMDHSKMGHSQVDQSTTDHSKMDHSKVGHSAMDHSGMGHHQADSSAAPSHPSIHDRPPPTGLPVPAPTDEDRAAAFPDVHGHTTHDQRVVHFVQFNRLEAWNDDGEAGQAWEGHAWVGTDHHKLWLRTEGEREDGETVSADIEVLYGRPVAAWWDFVAGVRHDFQPGGSQTFAAIGVMGLAPYKFELQATAYIGQAGRTEARIEAEYETLLTNRLVLQSLVEATLHGQDDEGRGVGSGLGTVEAGMRLRYEITRRFAPYVGVAWERAYGNTADLRREEGHALEETRVVAGVRVWF